MNRADRIGYGISGALHLGVILWVLTGGAWFHPKPDEPMVISRVAVVSEHNFNALMASAPKPSDKPAPAPPPAPKIPENIPEEIPDMAEAQNTPDTTPDTRARPVAPPEMPMEEVVEEVAPPEATTRIVAEADKPVEKEQTLAPLISPRPPNKTRPQPKTSGKIQTASSDAAQEPNTEAPEPAAPSGPANKERRDAVEDALTAALGRAGQGGTGLSPSGPPITTGEKDALIVDVKRCWNVGALSSDALRTTVTISFNMQPDGHPILSSIRLVGSRGGSGSAVDQAFEAGKRAIVRCGADGFPLPPAKYDRWKTIEIDFDPNQMRMK